MTRIPHLATEGDAYARGLAHGRRFVREISDNVATYLRRFGASGLGREEAMAEAEQWRKAIATQAVAASRSTCAAGRCSTPGASTRRSRR